MSAAAFAPYTSACRSHLRDRNPNTTNTYPPITANGGRVSQSSQVRASIHPARAASRAATAAATDVTAALRAMNSR